MASALTPEALEALRSEAWSTHGALLGTVRGMVDAKAPPPPGPLEPPPPPEADVVNVQMHAAAADPPPPPPSVPSPEPLEPPPLQEEPAVVVKEEAGPEAAQNNRVYVRLCGFWFTPEQAAKPVPNLEDADDDTDDAMFPQAQVRQKLGASNGMCGFPGCILKERHGGPHRFSDAMLAGPTPKRQASAPRKWEPDGRESSPSDATSSRRDKKPGTTPGAGSSASMAHSSQPATMVPIAGGGGSMVLLGRTAGPPAPAAVGGAMPPSRSPHSATAAPRPSSSDGGKNRKRPLTAAAMAGGMVFSKQRPGAPPRAHASPSAVPMVSPPARPAPIRHTKVHLKLSGWWAKPETLRMYRLWALEGMCNFPGCPLADRHNGPHQWCQETADLQWDNAPLDKRAA